MTSTTLERVLLVEDDPDIRTVAGLALEASGRLTILACESGEEAVRRAPGFAPQLVLLDYMMPGMDGPATLSALRALPGLEKVPVVIMTAYESDEVFQEAKLAGVGAYLIKPPKTGSIQRAVELAVARNEDLVELSRTNRELRDALLRIKTLEGILPICSSCHKIRDGQGDWQRLEAYISRHTEARFSHSVCPDCEKILYPDFADL